MTDAPYTGPVQVAIRVDITLKVTDPTGHFASDEFSVVVGAPFLHNLGGIAADETQRAVARLIRKIGDATGKRERPAVEDTTHG